MSGIQMQNFSVQPMLGTEHVGKTTQSKLVNLTTGLLIFSTDLNFVQNVEAELEVWFDVRAVVKLEVHAVVPACPKCQSR
jgi:hypothetical protein